MSSTNKTDNQDIAEILLKVALNTINLNLTLYAYPNWREDIAMILLIYLPVPRLCFVPCQFLTCSAGLELMVFIITFSYKVTNLQNRGYILHDHHSFVRISTLSYVICHFEFSPPIFVSEVLLFFFFLNL